MFTQELLTDLKKAHGNATEYRIAQLLGVRSQTVYKWKHGKGTMSDEVGLRAAKLLGRDPAKILLDLHIERETSEEAASIWQTIRDRLHVAALPAVVAVVGYSAGTFSGAPLI